MKKHEAETIARRVLELRRAARVGAGAMPERAEARRKANELFESIPARARGYIGAWFWDAIAAE